MIPLCRHFFNWAKGDSALFNRFSRESFVYKSFPNFIETWFLMAVPFYFVASHPINIFFTTLCMFLIDVAVDMCWHFGKDFQHRMSLLEQDVSILFAVAAHLIANIYVIVLEFGRLYGHVKRGHVFNIGKRFDWHCGQLENSKKHFVRREKVKFILFMVVIFHG